MHGLLYAVRHNLQCVAQQSLLQHTVVLVYFLHGPTVKADSTHADNQGLAGGKVVVGPATRQNRHSNGSRNEVPCTITPYGQVKDSLRFISWVTPHNPLSCTERSVNVMGFWTCYC